MKDPRSDGPRSAAAVLAIAIACLVLSPAGSAGAGSPADGIPLTPTAAWVVAENQLPGTTEWKITKGSPRAIEGYANRASAQAEQWVTLYVSTTAASFRVKAYRLGFYGGLGGRLVWTSAERTGAQQPEPTLDPATNMIEAPWSPSLTFQIGSGWTQGTYLLKLIASDGSEGYVPLTVRDDSSRAALVIQNSVTTWQAYNRWGGYSLYKGNDGTSRSRSRVVSFDRPYRSRRGLGLLKELPLIALAEKLGLDITYWTNIDMHERPGLLANHQALISLKHDEYWSSAMREGALAARAQGVNIAFLGANADYRHVRFEPSPLGINRRMVCYKVAAEDPLYGINDAEVTSNWRDPPVPRPESVLNGGLYQCNPVHADLVVREPESWVFSDTDLADGDLLPGLVDEEYDRVDVWAPTPDSIQILAHSPLTCRGKADYADLTYYTASSGAGVIDVGTLGWIPALACRRPVRDPTCVKPVVKITTNILRTFARAPAGINRPSTPNLDRFGLVLRNPIST